MFGPFPSWDHFCDALTIICDSFVTWSIAWSNSSDWRAFGQEDRLVMWIDEYRKGRNVVTLTPDICNKLRDLFSENIRGKKKVTESIDLAIKR